MMKFILIALIIVALNAKSDSQITVHQEKLEQNVSAELDENFLV